MAKATTKPEGTVTITPQERVEEFAKRVKEASDALGIGLGLRVLYEPQGSRPDLYYVDLTEKKEVKDEQK